MAITHRGISSRDGKREMSMEEFKGWLKKFDADKDGKISKDELREAIRATGGWFSKWKSRRGVRTADANHNGFIDDNEINNLEEFAQKQLGVRIISKDELEEAIRVRGEWFSKWKSERGVRSADANHNGFIHDNEINNLVEFAQKYLGVRIVNFSILPPLLSYVTILILLGFATPLEV
ncbi:hypothetical protein L1049_025625 [Liquidambar formosana]|uniref:EF-hand domain-containing protein n=1 Tax=Liquidambar formosana TaxID=63359 RepID=A0AAP0ND92_LIQFO